jgi:hypothetical protein
MSKIAIKTNVDDKQNMNNGRKVTKLSKKYYTLVFGVIMGFIMSVLTSLAVTMIISELFIISSKCGSAYF